MTRNSIIMTALAACITAALLTVPAATASSDGHYDCTQRTRFINKSRAISAHTMIYLNYYLDSADNRYEEAIDRIRENAGNEAAVNLHSTDATKHIVWDLEYLHRRLHRLERRKLRRFIRRCPALFGANRAQINNARNRATARAVELRDLLDEAVAMYADSEGEPE